MAVLNSCRCGVSIMAPRVSDANDWLETCVISRKMYQLCDSSSTIETEPQKQEEFRTWREKSSLEISSTPNNPIEINIMTAEVGK